MPWTDYGQAAMNEKYLDVIMPAFIIIIVIIIIAGYLFTAFILKKRFAIQLEKQVQLRTKRIEDSEKELRNIYDNVHDAIFIFGPEGEIIYDVNARACQIYGFSRDEFIGMSLEKISKNVPRGKVKIRETLQQGDFLNFETVHFRKDMSEMCLEINASVINYRDKIAILSINRDVTQRKLAEQQIQKSLEEKEILLKEIHHRVKNNLQIISSLMDLQLDTVETLQDPKVFQLFQQSKDRIRSMALIHENIYQSQDMSGIDGIKYTGELLDYFFSSYGSNARNITPFIKIEKPLTSISLTMEAAIPLGLIITELLTNSLKHAFPQGRKGKIDIIFSSASSGTLTLTVSDNGVGLPPGFNTLEAQTLGLKLVTLLTKQLKGTLKIAAGNGENQGSGEDEGEGATIKITFPYPVQ